MVIGSPRIVPRSEARAEIIVNKSRFIASASRASTPEEAREYILRVKLEYPDASHHVPAFIIGHGAGITTHCSDAGEPSGTAGRPVLAVLLGSGLGDVVVVVTRYFGGILLGTGGLVRAYSDAVRAVLTVIPRAEKVSTVQALVRLPYTYLDRARLLVEKFSGKIESEEFEEDVRMNVRFREELFDPFQIALQNMTRGSVQAIIISRDSNSIMPI